MEKLRAVGARADHRPRVDADAVKAAMPPLAQVQIRCGECNRRLADLVNEIETGQVLVELKCPRCGQPHLEVIRAPGSVAI